MVKATMKMNLTTNLKYLFKLIETFLRKVLYFYLVLRLSLVSGSCMGSTMFNCSYCWWWGGRCVTGYLANMMTGPRLSKSPQMVMCPQFLSFPCCTISYLFPVRPVEDLLPAGRGGPPGRRPGAAGLAGRRPASVSGAAPRGSRPGLRRPGGASTRRPSATAPGPARLRRISVARGHCNADLSVHRV